MFQRFCHLKLPHVEGHLITSPKRKWRNSHLKKIQFVWETLSYKIIAWSIHIRKNSEYKNIQIISNVQIVLIAGPSSVCEKHRFVLIESGLRTIVFWSLTHIGPDLVDASLIHLWGIPRSLLRGKNGKTLINLLKAKNHDTKASRVRSIKFLKPY